MISCRTIWRPLARHRAVLLGAVLIGLVWTAVSFFSGTERQIAERTAVENSTNLAGALADHLSHSLGQVDRVLAFVAALYAQDSRDLDLPEFLESNRLLHDNILQLAVIGPDGKTKSISRTSGPEVHAADLEQALNHADPGDGRTFVGKTQFLDAAGKWSIDLSRRIIRGDGSFAGIIVASLDLSYLTRPYESVNIGDRGYVRIIGTDGIVRASTGRAFSLIGSDFAQADLFRNYSESAAGWFYTNSSLSDNVKRLIAYRALNDYPLIITVGVAANDIFSRFEAQKNAAYLIAVALSLLIAAGAAVSFRSQRARDAAAARLEHTNMLLNAALANMSHGICMFGADQKLILANDLYSTMYGLDPQRMKSGITLAEILKARVAAGACPLDARTYVETRIHEAFLPQPGCIIDKLRDGRTIAISRRALPDGGMVGVHQDITAHLHVEQKFDETKQFLNSIIENIPIAVVVKDAVTREFVLVNRAFEAMLKVGRNEILGKTVFDIFQRSDAERIDASENEAISGEIGRCVQDYELEMPDGEMRVLATNRLVVRDASGEAKHLVVVIDDITERKKSEQRIAFMAHHDVLTGLANRLSILDKIEEAVVRHRRRGDSFAVLLLDLDRFKHVNDTLGHAVGDALLRETAARLKASLRETDVLARLGGDEFAIVQDREQNQRDAASALADRIIEIVSRPFNIEGHEVNIATSIGIALAPEHATSSESLMKMADLALYRAKSAGRNGYQFFDPEMSMAASARHELESELRRAIQSNELELHYQPIVDTQSCMICGAEALIRWRHPTKGIILPDQFIPLAEETGMIKQIGEWIIQTACAEAATWPASIKVSVNLSAVQFRKDNLFDVAICALAQSGLAPERLELEITETALIESATECLPVLRRFKNLGIAIALDDFGTGYSSLSQLMMFPFDKIKVDKSFTQNLTKRTECAAIIAATLTLARSLDIATTAEGVETIDQYRLLRMAGVTSLQGYLFQRPCPSGQLDFNNRYIIPEIENAA
ncbi:MAG TPA: EAL domain-containing protein [Pseudolabrys sp.]|nr:EAL domain-containing protein [Pseudolabrys sp.]